MSEEKDLLENENENQESTGTENTSAVVDEDNQVTEQSADETTDENQDVSEQPIDNTLDNVTAESTENELEPKKGVKKGLVIGIIVALVVAIGTTGFVLFNKFYNKYNMMGYTNLSGRTLADIAEDSGMTVEEFIKEYELPADMKPNTTEAAAFYMIPTKKIAEMYGLDFATLKSSFQLGDSVTETTPWGEAEGQIKLGVYLGGEEALQEFKTQYGLDDSVTADTLWKDVRKTVEKKQLEEKKAQENASQNQTEATPATENDSTNPDETASTDASEAPAESPQATAEATDQQ